MAADPTTAVAEASAPAPLAVRRPPLEAIKALERVVIAGDLGFLSEEERVRYYARVCESLGLNPLTRPFEYITLNSKLTLYVRKDATDQLRQIHGVSIGRLERERDSDLGLYTVIAYAVDRYGREDSGMGVVAIKGLAGEGLANAMMKAETKAKRRATLSIVGLGWMDEVEALDTRAVEIAPRQALASGIASRTAALEAAGPAEAAPAPSEAPACAHPKDQHQTTDTAVVCGLCGTVLAERPAAEAVPAPAARPRARSSTKAKGGKTEPKAPLQPGEAGYGSARAHAEASERGLDHDAVHRIAVDVLQVEEADIAAFSLKDVPEDRWDELIAAVSEPPVADDAAESWAGQMALQAGMGSGDDPWPVAAPAAAEMFGLPDADSLSPAQWREFGIRAAARNPLP